MFSIITPTNNLKWLQHAWESIKAQTFKDWEWVLLLNGGIEAYYLPEEIRLCDKVRIEETNISGNIGALKRKACELAKYEIIVELDHDDQLAVNCLEKLYEAFTSPSRPVFAYSKCVHVTQSGQPILFGSEYGWKYNHEPFNGYNGIEVLLTPENPPLLPQNVSRIWYAPDHVRAWRKDAYFEVGGHNPDLSVCDDVDLMCRLYTKGPFYFIDACLYKYNVHGENAYLKMNDLINNDLMWKIHDRYIEHMALFYWKELVSLHNILNDLNKKWPWQDDSVGVIRANDVLGRIKDPIHAMNEAYRILKHGGLFLIEVPSTDGRGAFQDPTHVSFWNSNSFWYYTQETQQKHIKHAGINCRFQLVRLENYYPSEWHQQHNIIYTKCHLAAVKDGPRLHGILEI